MSSVNIRRREAKSGARFQVRYRLGGRGYPVVHGGSFPTLREARLRRDLIAGELAAGRNPAEALRAVPEQPVKTRTVAEWGAAMVASRLDVADNRIRFLNTALRTWINPTFGEQAPGSITAPEVQEWVAVLAPELAPRSVLKYWQVLAQVLDYAEIVPNPTRHKTVKLPYADVEEATPPSREDFLAIVEHLSPRLRLPAVFLEQTAARVSELRAWEWQDVDVQSSRIRSRGVKGRRGTRRVLWRPAPEWLMEVLLGAVPPDDRTAERKLFPGLNEGTMRDGIGRASRAAGLPLYSPHDLRHRRGSLWHASGIPARELAERMGHSKPSMSLDVYTHVMPPDEANADALAELLTARAR
jgi:integrase